MALTDETQKSKNTFGLPFTGIVSIGIDVFID